MQQGTVIRSTGKWYQVRLSDGLILPCRIIGKFRLHGMKLTNPVAVGDEVMVSMEPGEEKTGLIKKIVPRRNSVVRQSPRQKHHLHLLAANVDQAVLIATIIQPDLKPGFIDRFLLMTEPHNIPTVIVLNKADLYNQDQLELFDALEYLYSDIGYQVLLASAHTGIGIDRLKKMLQGKTSMISGQSGVGKSSLINAVQPLLGLRTTELSDYSGKGQHTTTFAEMLPLDDGGYIIDTPGIKTLSFNYLEPQDVAHNFREFFQRSTSCRFHNCTHRNEPGCAVKEAVENGKISELRYQNYLAIMDEIEQQNYWERHK
ncbi:MAG: ribosome small subunit-dependent GTPase A [Saprospiraceae bacterium]